MKVTWYFCDLQHITKKRLQNDLNPLADMVSFLVRPTVRPSLFVKNESAESPHKYSASGIHKAGDERIELRCEVPNPA